MDDHVQKLFWALWSPSRSDRITGEQIEEFRELAQQIHERRKGALYFDPTAATLPREAVSAEEAETVIGLAESRLGMQAAKSWVTLGSEQAENMRFFSEAVADTRWREFVFGGASLAKLAEVGDVPDWIAWLRTQIEEAERRAIEAARRELSRAAPAGDEEGRREKWSMRLRFFSESHSIRARPLNSWNDGIEWIKLRRAKANELIVDLTMPRAVLVASVWGSGYMLAQRLLLALNIGTLGFFWWRPRTDIARYYEELRDLSSRLQSAQTRGSQVLRKATVQTTFKELYEYEQARLRLRPLRHEDGEPPSRPAEVIRAGRGATLVPWVIEPDSLARGELIEVEVELSAEPIFRMSTVISALVEMMRESDELARAAGAAADLEQMGAVANVIERLLVGLIPIRGRAIDYSVIEHGGREWIVHRRIAEDLLAEGALRRELFLVGVADEALFWKDIRRVLFSNSRYRVLCRVSRPGVQESWTPVKRWRS